MPSPVFSSGRGPPVSPISPDCVAVPVVTCNCVVVGVEVDGIGDVDAIGVIDDRAERGDGAGAGGGIAFEPKRPAFNRRPAGVRVVAGKHERAVAVFGQAPCARREAGRRRVAARHDTGLVGNDVADGLGLPGAGPERRIAAALKEQARAERLAVGRAHPPTLHR